MSNRSFNNDQWRHIYQLAQAVVEVPEDQRRQYLEFQATDPEITLEVLELVATLDAADDDPPSRTGTTVGRFEIGEFLGSGGTGGVYAARDPELGRDVAVKFLRAEQHGLPAATERFIREARTASALNHPNIVTVHEILRGESTLAIVMELVKGTALRQICGQAVALPKLLDIGQQAAEALSAAHAAGVVHRDIKPENLMLTSGGRLKVLDFGLARLSVSGNDTLGAGVPAGTLRYMSPEHYHGARITTQSDVFALGLVLYELAAGRHPFGNNDSMDMLYAIATEEAAALSSLNPAVPRAIDNLIRRMLDKDPGKRPTSDEVASQLRAISEPTRAQSRLNLRLPWISGSVALSLLLAALAWRFYPSVAGPGTLEQSTHLIAENRVTAAAISGDGKYMAYANSDGIFLQLLHSGELNTLKEPNDFIADHLTWLPDGSRLIASGFSEETSRPAIWLVSVNNAAPRLLHEDARFGSPSPDGKRLVFLGGDYSSIWLMDLEAQSVQRIVQAATEDSFASVYWAANSRHVVATRKHYPPRGSSVKASAGAQDYLESIDAKDGSTVDSKRDVTIWSATMLPGGELVFASSELLSGEGRGKVWSLKMDLVSGRFSSEIKELRVPPSFAELGTDALTATNDGSKIALIRLSINQPVFVADFNRAAVRFSNFRRLTLNDSGNYPHSWTGDSQSVLYESNRARHSFDLFKQRLSQHEPEALTATPERSEVLPQLTPDQRSILFAASQPGSPGYSLMRIPVEGGVEQEVPIGGPLDEFRCSPHPRGRCVLRKTIGVSEFIYYELDPIQGIGRELARAAWWPSVLADWDISPDGRFVAFPNHDPRSGKVRVIRVDSNGTEAKEREFTIPMLTRLSSLSWAADGTAWFLSVETSIGKRMYFYDLKGHLTSLGTIQGWAVPSPDGKKVAFLNNITLGNAWIWNRDK